jgi:2-hydroxy-6-oxonona-2,4-dienedioate hydrolase
LLLHGAHGFWAHWTHNIAALAAAGCRVWVPDLPGYGDSALAEGDGHAPIVDALAAGLHALDAIRPGGIDIVGFSFGGVIAGHIAARHPEVVRRLVLVDAGGLGTPLGDLHLQRLRGLQPAELHDAIRNNLLQVMLHDPAKADDLAMHIQMSGAARARLNPTELILPDRLMPALAGTSAQIDAIWGECDRPHPDPHLHKSVLRRFDSAAEMAVIPNAGHWAMYEQPALFNQVLLEMLGRPIRH